MMDEYSGLREHDMAEDHVKPPEGSGTEGKEPEGDGMEPAQPEGGMAEGSGTEAIEPEGSGMEPAGTEAREPEGSGTEAGTGAPEGKICEEEARRQIPPQPSYEMNVAQTGYDPSCVQSGYGGQMQPVQPGYQPVDWQLQSGYGGQMQSGYGGQMQPQPGYGGQLQFGYGGQMQQQAGYQPVDWQVQPQAGYQPVQPGYGGQMQSGYGGQMQPVQAGYQPGYGGQMQSGYGGQMPQAGYQPVDWQMQSGYGGQMPPRTEYQMAPPYDHSQRQTGSSDGIAIASMVLGIVSLLTCAWFYLGLPCAVVGLILGCVYRGKGGKNGMAIAGIACNSAGTALGLLMLFGALLEIAGRL